MTILEEQFLELVPRRLTSIDAQLGKLTSAIEAQNDLLRQLIEKQK